MAASLVDGQVGDRNPMTDITPSSFRKMPEWELLTEFFVTTLPQSRRSVTTRITEAIQNINIQQAQKERIYELMTQTVNRAKQNEQEGEQFYPVHIRIWSTATIVDRAGWGFFIVEKKRDDFQSETIENAFTVELFLYQERHP